MNVISVQNNLGLPKYKQIILSIEKAIEEEKLKKGDRLPSVNKVCLAFSLSRDTVLQAYDELKKRGIIYAIPGKGYYVKSVETTLKHRIFLLFDELNIFKEDIYNSFLKNIGKNVQVDIFFHHFNVKVFQKLINDSNGNYTKYIIMPTNLNDVVNFIKTLPVNEVIILDQTNENLKSYPAIYQNHQKDIFEGLFKAKSRLNKYKKLILIFPGFREPLGMKSGFEDFCDAYHFNYEIITEFTAREITTGDLYIIPNDRDLVKVIENAGKQSLKLGSDFGIISYNETPLKKIAANGITTISTHFEAMGKILAEMVLKGNKEQIENKSSLTIRNSL
ncbi:MAG: GntR family transcriptional regulator [Flavobacterium circumlabens]|uniref:GntR family transcriptional regulator n=1 Tax=Flavobacterium circumlabens TaxID=2133765 RepID=A0A4Y7UKG7_9FLAO|nr:MULTISPECIES: GntR family transcriptional regulator [Flavobacterium]QSB27241.1 GntR family transcriptional regulator [Flavobacterium sp. CLA17]TCN61102.1 regulatory GntR family protein [Flavobacterium circumlabens]TEB46208.1 GntR family transcriptional regulator [Flavobacterium circumlabens]